MFRKFLAKFYPPAATDRELRKFFDAVADGPAGLVEDLLARDPGLATRQGMWGASAVHMLERAEFTEKLDLLLIHGADINARDDKGHTLIHMLDGNGARFLPDLIARGADINARENEGRTPLMIFLEVPYSREMIEALLEAGADPSGVDNQGCSVLDYAQDYEGSEDDDILGLIRQALSRQGEPIAGL